MSQHVKDSKEARDAIVSILADWHPGDARHFREALAPMTKTASGRLALRSAARRLTRMQTMAKGGV